MSSLLFNYFHHVFNLLFDFFNQLNNGFLSFRVFLSTIGRSITWNKVWILVRDIVSNPVITELVANSLFLDSSIQLSGLGIGLHVGRHKLEPNHGEEEVEADNLRHGTQEG